MNQTSQTSTLNKVSFTGLIITLGIVYGDIGTSPLYVMRAIISGVQVITPEFIYGAISCVIWTLTFQTTFKYVIITLKADNKGEGGIFSLFALVRRKAPWVFVFAIIGGSTLLADGIITPSITVVSAVEGLEIIDHTIPVLPIVLIIITLLFIIQQFGTKMIGNSFGPIMFFWFLMLGILGFTQILKFPMIIKSFNPYYAYKLLSEHHEGFILLGAVFLCTTGAEALYSDLGHCGRKNINTSWVYVKVMLILNYLGQGAWIIMNKDHLGSQSNPFFAMMPSWFLLPGIIIATVAAVIASQALITGSFTIISEAILLNLWPKIKINHPTNIKGQMYVPAINWILYFACIFVILLFKNSSNMEAAYGLAITITMLMTTILLSFHLYLNKHRPLVYIIGFLLIYLSIEGSFLISNLNKFIHGGWVTIFIAAILSLVMYVWFKGRSIKTKFYHYVNISHFVEIIKDLSKDQTVPKFATNLVYLTNSNFQDELESKIVYSIINKRPKRADIYWFLHVTILDEPYTMEYRIKKILPGVIYRIDFRIGFKVNPRINLFFRQIVDELKQSKEIDLISNYESLRKHKITGDFRFIIIDRIQNFDFRFKNWEQFILDFYDILRKIGISEIKAFGLDTSNVEIEKVPLIVSHSEDVRLTRID